MAKTFRSWDVEQRWLLPPLVNELVPDGHLAHFVRDTFRDELDLSSIMSEYSEFRGRTASPTMPARAVPDCLLVGAISKTPVEYPILPAKLLSGHEAVELAVVARTHSG